MFRCSQNGSLLSALQPKAPFLQKLDNSACPWFCCSNLHIVHPPRLYEKKGTKSTPSTMSTRSVVVIELPERSCSPQQLEYILSQVRVFYHRLSTEFCASTGQRLCIKWVRHLASNTNISADILTYNRIGPWQAQHHPWATEHLPEAPQGSQNGTVPLSLPLRGLASPIALRASSVHDDEMPMWAPILQIVFARNWLRQAGPAARMRWGRLARRGSCPWSILGTRRGFRISRPTLPVSAPILLCI